MRLLFVVRGLYPRELGGAQRHSYHLIKELAGAGAEVGVVHPYGERILTEPVREYPLGVDARRYRGLLGYTRAVAKLLRREEPAYDVIYGDGISLIAHLPHKAKPCLFNPHGLPAYQDGAFWSVKTWIARRNILLCARSSDYTISLGGRLTTLIRDRLGLPADRILELPNGVDLATVGRRSTDRARGSYLFVGSLVANKGIRQLTEIISRSRDIAASFVVVGDGPLAGLLSTQRSQKVVLMGKVSDPDVLSECYDRAECLIVPSLRDGMPTVILEAMAHGLPVIATDVGAVGTIVVDGQNGFLVRPGDTDGFLGAMSRFARLPAEERERMGQASLGHVEQYSWPRIARRYLEFAEAVIRKLPQEGDCP